MVGGSSRGGNKVKSWYGGKNTLDICRDQGKGKDGDYIPYVLIFRSNKSS